MESPASSLKDKVDTLRHCVFLAGMPENTLNELARRAELLRVPAGEAVINKGEPGSTMYFVISGRVRVHDGEIGLAWLDDGEVFGEMAVLDSEVRSASVTTEQDSMLLALEREDLLRELARSPECFQVILHAVLQRERHIVEDVRTRTRQVLAFEKELEIGRRIQADFLPRSLPDISRWEIAACFEAAREVAGDFYDVFQLKELPHVGIVIGDVCDKGVGAALFMTLFRSLIRASALYGGAGSALPGLAGVTDTDRVRELLLNSVLTTNRYVATTHSHSSMFASVFFGLLDPESGTLTYVNAGHEAPVLFRHGGGSETLALTGGVLGLFPEAPFACETVQLHPGDLLLGYTDGVNEAKDADGGQFTDQRILALEAPQQGSAAACLEGLLERIRAFRGEAPQSDDITMIAAKFLPG